MAVFQKRVTFYRCEKCGYEWPQRFPNTPPPTVCANRACKATTWNTPRRQRRGKRATRPLRGLDALEEEYK